MYIRILIYEYFIVMQKWVFRKYCPIPLFAQVILAFIVVFNRSYCTVRVYAWISYTAIQIWSIYQYIGYHKQTPEYCLHLPNAMGQYFEHLNTLGWLVKCSVNFLILACDVQGTSTTAGLILCTHCSVRSFSIFWAHRLSPIHIVETTQRKHTPGNIFQHPVHTIYVHTS